jgi:hypothetical protein
MVIAMAGGAGRAKLRGTMDGMKGSEQQIEPMIMFEPLSWSLLLMTVTAAMCVNLDTDFSLLSKR